MLKQVKATGWLVVATRNSPTSYYESDEGFEGLEYDLVELFAQELGVKTRYVVVADYPKLFTLVKNRMVNLAAAGLSPTLERSTQVRFGPAYQEVKQQIVYKRGNWRPRQIEHLIGKDIEVVAGSSHEVALAEIAQDHPALTWQVRTGVEVAKLLELVREEMIDYTIANSNEILLHRRFYPDLHVALNLAESLPLAWAFAHSDDSSLFDAATTFFERIKDDGTLAQLVDRYYGHLNQLTFVDTRDFKRHYTQRLPQFEALFREAAEEVGIDWRLLAAIGYQESHWNPKAISPTGVRGIMMLTLITAERMGIDSRLDPAQSIAGGARYIGLLEAQLPKRIAEPDRLWLALAGYNIGFGHLEDARVLAEQLGMDPDKWADVKQVLPLLREEKWYSQVKHGAARGQEPVVYVDNIRSYYDLLLWLDSQDKTEPAGVPKILSEAPATL